MVMINRNPVLKGMVSKRVVAGQKALFCAFLTMLVLPLAAKHPSNPGPEQFELRFQLPPPPPLSPEQALATFQIAPGFRIEVIAAEPLVEDPIAMSFDASGRLYVVEMRGYMHDVEGAGEDKPIGRVKLLEDSDGDGVMDRSTVFLDGLIMPRAVMAVANGALVAEPPNLFFCRDTDGDGIADERTVVNASFGTMGGQPEHMANGPLWALDNWIYSSNFETRFRYQDGEWISAPTTKRGQWGLTQDDYGRLYYNYNSDFLRADLVPAHYYARNPYYTGAAGLNHKVVKDQTVWPSHPTPGVNRGYGKGALREDGTLTASTATCGPVIYRGHLFPKEFYGNAFIPEPAANLVKRFILAEENGFVSGRNATEGEEFLTSTDERFRPVNAYNGPDGALYILDMYRGVLQHKAFLTHYLIANIKQRKLESPIGMGRIYRILPENSAPKAVRLPESSSELVAFLEHANGWVRQNAQRVLVERGDTAVVADVTKVAMDGPSPASRLQALWTLEGLGAVDAELTMALLDDSDSKVRATAIRLSEPFLIPGPRAQTLPKMIKALGDPSADVQIQLAFTLSAVVDPEAEGAVADLLAKAGENPLVRDAAISGLRGRELEMIERLLAHPQFEKGSKGASSVLAALAESVVNEGRAGRIERLLAGAAALKVGSSEQRALLTGMAGGNGSGKGNARKKLAYLDSEPIALQQLKEAGGEPMKKLLAALDERLAWPGKPGVPPPPKVTPLTKAEQELFEKGREMFAVVCAACHQPNGLGQEGLAPPLVDSEWVTGSPERLTRIVMQGMSGPVTVNGASYQMEMPGLAVLGDEDIAAVLTYIRREWDHNASPVPVSLVEKIRAATAERAAPWTAQELLKIP